MLFSIVVLLVVVVVFPGVVLLSIRISLSVAVVLLSKVVLLSMVVALVSKVALPSIIFIVLYKSLPTLTPSHNQSIPNSSIDTQRYINGLHSACRYKQSAMCPRIMRAPSDIQI